MPDYFRRLKAIAIASEATIGYVIAALFIVPAAVILALYPLNWVLGTVSFYTASLSLETIRPLLIVPILLGAIIAHRRKDWWLASMLVPGIFLMLFAPGAIGAHKPSHLDSRAFYPEQYAPAQVSARIKAIESAQADAGSLFRILPPEVPPARYISDLQRAAESSLGAWKDQAKRGERRAEIEGLLQKANTDLATIRANLAVGGVQRTPESNRLSNLIVDLTAQRNNLNAAGDLYPAAVSALSSLKTELESLERLVVEKASFAGALPYIIAASASFAIFVFVVGFLNAAMAGLAAMIVAVCLWSAWPVAVEDWAIELPLLLYPAFICVVSAFLLRFAFRGYLDNGDLKQRFGSEQLYEAGWRAVALWLPFPIIVASVVWLSSYVYDGATSTIYCEGIVKEFCGSATAEPPIRDSDPSRDTLRDDINAAIQRMLTRFEAEAVRGAASVGSNVATQVQQMHTQIMATFTKILPPNIYDIYPEMRPPNCRWFPFPQVKCFANRFALLRVNDAYRTPRNRLETRLNQALTNAGEKIKRGTANAATEFQEAIKGESQRAAYYATKSVDATFVWISVFAVLQMTLALIVLIRAFLLIFGRQLYKDHRSLSEAKRAPTAFPYLALTPSEKNEPAGGLAVESYEEKFSIGKNYLPLLAKRVSFITGDQATLPYPAKCTTWVGRRLRHRCLILTEVKPWAGKSSVLFTPPDKTRLVLWTIPKNVEVFFRWDCFVAITRSMKIKKTISLRIGGLATGTTMQASAVGPGVLVLRGRGEVELTDRKENPQAIVPSRLLAWKAGSTFQILSPQRATSVYFDPPSMNIKPRAFGSSDPGDSTPGIGLFRELRRLLRP